MSAQQRKNRKKDNQRFQETLYRILRFLLLPVFTALFQAKVEKGPMTDTPVIVVANHVSDYDFIYPAKVMKAPLSFVVGEGLLRKKWLRKLLVDGLGCIPKQKASKDATTTVAIYRRLKQGRNVCIFVEGNTTFSGVTGPFPEATGKLFGLVDAGLITLRIKGGYFLKPRWGRGLRRGKTACRVVATYSKEQLKAMSASDINGLLAKDLYEDAYDRQEKAPERYKSRFRAEGLEHALYLCPKCHAQNSLLGVQSELVCTSCKAKAEFTETGHIRGDFPYSTVRDWLAWQKEELKRNTASEGSVFLLKDSHQTLFYKTLNDEMEPKAEGVMQMDSKKLMIGDFFLPIHEIAGLEIYRKNVIQFSTRDGRYFQTDKQKGFNALKYRDLYEILKAGD